MRNKPHVMDGLSVIVADEVHLINDSSRGPTMEINLTRFLHSKNLVQIILLLILSKKINKFYLLKVLL